MPCIYIKDNILLVHGHPEFNSDFVENMLAPELVEQGDCNEDDLDMMKKEWKSMPLHRLNEVRELVQFFITS